MSKRPMIEELRRGTPLERRAAAEIERAADEIEWLRAENKLLRETLDNTGFRIKRETTR